MTDKKYTKENIWVIIPAYNESKRIENVLTQLQKITPNIIVVDDGSTDRTSEIATKLGITTIQPKKNIGKGGALIKGIDHAIYAKNAQGIVMLDADGQHDPTLTELFIDSLNGADIVFGSRQLNSNMPTIRRIGNHLITKTLQTLYGIKITDALSGDKAMTTETYFKISWPENNH
jgi:glycosyltransferase involved in cell wall biosynthesis